VSVQKISFLKKGTPLVLHIKNTTWMDGTGDAPNAPATDQEIVA
jgi:hypothetical protein